MGSFMTIDGECAREILHRGLCMP